MQTLAVYSRGIPVAGRRRGSSPPTAPCISANHGRYRAAFALLTFLASGTTSAWPQDDVVTVSVVAAQSGEVEGGITVVGTIVAREETQVSVDLDGVRIDTILVEEGDTIQRGQLLATVDAEKIEVELLLNDARQSNASAVVGQAESAVETAEISKRESEADLARSLKLAAKGVVSGETLEQKQNAADRSAASLRSAEKALDVARAVRLTAQAERKDIQLRLQRTRLVAPISGKIMTRTAKVGAMATSSGLPLFVIANDGALELEAQIPQSQFSRLRAGSRTMVSFHPDSAPTEGLLRFIAPAVDVATRLGRVRIALPNGVDAPVGAFARAQILTGAGSGIFLPDTAVIATDIGPEVKVVKDGKVASRQIVIGSSNSGLVEVRSGLAVGEFVVLKASAFVSAGDAVTPYQVSYDLARTPLDNTARAVDIQ
jgi:RND family efflux transporter MFP subunit